MSPTVGVMVFVVAWLVGLALVLRVRRRHAELLADLSARYGHEHVPVVFESAETLPITETAMLRVTVHEPSQKRWTLDVDTTVPPMSYAPRGKVALFGETYTPDAGGGYRSSGGSAHFVPRAIVNVTNDDPPLRVYLLWSAIAAVIAGAFFGFDVGSERALADHGVHAMGTVLEKYRHEEPGSRRSNSYALSVRIEGVPRYMSAPESAWDSVEIEGPVDVVYLPESPDVVRVAGQVPFGFELLLGLSVISLVVAGVTQKDGRTTVDVATCRSVGNG